MVFLSSFITDAQTIQVKMHDYQNLGVYIPYMYLIKKNMECVAATRRFDCGECLKHPVDYKGD